jgi:hypothetical protein
MIKPSSNITEISWHRTGGFAGLDETLIIKSNRAVSLSSNVQGEKKFTLSKAEWADLTTMIEDSGILEIDETYGPKAGVADFFTYSMQVKTGSKSKHLEWVDDWASEEEPPKGLVDVTEHMLKILSELEMD